MLDSSYSPYSNSLKVRIGKWVLKRIHGWDGEKYFRRRDYVIDPNKKNLLRKFYYLYYIKRVDSKWHCSFGTNINFGSKFLAPPILPHGPNGIIVGYRRTIGRNVIIYQHVTISSGEGTIGDNVLLGAGSVVLPDCSIGHNAKIGANTVVVEDVPSGATVVGPKPRIIIKER